MSAGTAYSKRYAGGFVDKPSTASPIDSTFLNAVETALLQLMGSAPTVDGQVQQWDFANTRFGPALLLNKNVDPTAAIASSKIDFTGGNALTNAAIAGAAAIARSKLDFGSGLVNADVAAAAAIAYSKLNLSASIKQSDMATAFVDAPSGKELAYVEFTSNVTTSGSSTFATGVSVVSAGALTFDGATKIRVEFYAPGLTQSSGSNSAICSLADGGAAGTDLGWLAISAQAANSSPVFGVREFTPAAAAKTYSIVLWQTVANTATVLAGAGAGARMPGFIRIARV